MDIARERQLFESALELAEHERAAFLRSACRDEEERGRVERLLAAHQRITGADRAFLGSFVRPMATPERIGPYRIAGHLGSGGMGDVYLADQFEPVQRRVALKLLRPAFAGREMLARFDGEREALALLDHPNIARILDAGSTEDGRPYVVMEYVPGPAITGHADDQRMSIVQRLDLFLQVCSGVRHAHQRGIIHRDLKPSNLLVAEVDGRPVPKIIDFGIAKAATAAVGGRGSMTAIGQLVGTPDYMSPEQAELVPLDIDTRADVFALGVVLCELLCGRLPYPPIDTGAGLLAVARTIAAREAVRPSVLLARDPAALAAAVESRATSSRRLSDALSGDLDWIVLKALEPDRSRRYGSAMELADDIERWRRSEPVSARSPDTLYVAGRFVRRNRGAVAATAAALASLAIFGVLMAGQARETARERDRATAEAATARRVSQFLVETLGAADPEKHLGREPSARQLLDDAGRRMRVAFADEPAARAELELALGDIYHSLGEYAPSLQHLGEALALYRQQPAHELRGRLNASRKIGRGLAQSGRVPDGERVTIKVRDAAALAFGTMDLLYVDATHDLGVVRSLQAKYPEALELFQFALEGRERLLGPTHTLTAIAQTNVAAIQQQLGQSEAAERSYRQAIERMSRAAGDDDSRVVIARFNLSTLYAARDDFARALEQQQRIVPRLTQTYGPDHPFTLTAIGNLASTLSNLERHDESYPLLADLVGRLTATLGATHQTTLMYRAALAFDAGMLGRRDEASRDLPAVIAEQRRQLGDSHRDVVYSRSALATLQRRWGEHSRAVENLAAVVEPSRSVLGATHRRTREILLMLADSSFALADLQAGARWLDQARAAGADALGSLEDYPELARRRKAEGPTR